MNQESRRDFLVRAGGWTAASLLGRAIGEGRSAVASNVASTLPALTSRPSTGQIAPSAKSIVAHIRAPEVIDGQRVHDQVLLEFIEEGVKLCTQSANAADGWNILFKSDDVIGIKFNSVGADMLRTTIPFATRLVASLKRAGIGPDRVVLIEAPEATEIKALKTTRAAVGWSDKEVSFGSGSEQLPAVLSQVTALINVPFLKTHNIASMTGCLKNLSHALVRRPQRYHANGCTPYVGDIVAMPQIRSKLRIHIINALHAVFSGGPQPVVEGIWAHSGIVVSKDPVAADSVGMDILNDQRAKVKLPPISNAMARIPHVHAAAELGLGTDDQDYIELLEPRMY